MSFFLFSFFFGAALHKGQGRAGQEEEGGGGTRVRVCEERGGVGGGWVGVGGWVGPADRCPFIIALLAAAPTVVQQGKSVKQRASNCPPKNVPTEGKAGPAPKTAWEHQALHVFKATSI